MKTRFLFPALLALTALAASAAPGEYIVQLDSNADPDVVMRFHGAGAKQQGNGGRAIWKRALKGWAGPLNANQLARLQTDSRVLSVETNGPVTAQSQTIPTGVRRIGCLSNAVWTASSVTPINADIAILDTGIDLANADLNVVGGVTFIAGTTTAQDDNGHGTHVAGIAAAMNNSIGVVGVAPGARLYAVKVLASDGRGDFAGLISGIDWVTQHASTIEVANVSMGGQANGGQYAVRAAIQASVAAGVVWVVAAGNSSFEVYGNDKVLDTDDDFIPASCPEALTVSALADSDGQAGGVGQRLTMSNGEVDPDDSLAKFSNWSGTVDASNPVYSPGKAIDVAAPGGNILSLVPTGSCLYCSPTGLRILDGTSQACPHVAGAVALYCAAIGRATDAAGVYAIRQWFIDHAEPQTAWGINLTTPFGNDTGPEGLLSVLQVGQVWAPTGTPPVVAITSPISNASYLAGAAITFTGTATNDANVGISSSLIWNSSIQGQIGTGATFSRTLTNGNHTVTAQAVDSNGNLGFAAKAITVQASGNNPPVLTITAPTNNAIFATGTTVTFSGVATDKEDGTISASIKWYFRGTQLLGTGASVSAAFAAGLYSMAAVITDSGLASTTNQVNFQISDTAPLPPPTTNYPPNVMISAPLSGASYPEGTPVLLTASATDREDGDLTASIAWTDSPDGALGTGCCVTNSTLSVGAHTTTASVADSTGQTNFTTVAYTITATNPPPVTPSLSVAVATDATSYINKQKARVTVTVTSGGVVSGASVNVAIRGASGKVINKTGLLTGAAGTASYSQTIQRNQLGVGTARVSATATKSGYNAGYGTNSFTIR